MKLRHGWVLVLLAGLSLSTPSLRADGLIRDGVGPISTGRGGTNQGFADNSVVIMDNPAAMVNVSGSGLGELGVDVVMPAVAYADPYNDVHSKIRPMPAPVLGFIKKSDDDLWAWGVGAFAPAGFGASYGINSNPVTGSNLLRSIGAMGKILPAVSFRATDRLAVGISVGVAFCHAELDGPVYLQTGPLAGVPAILDMQGTGVAPCGSVGLQYQLTDSTMIGCTYTEQTNFDLRGGTNATLLPGFVLESRFDNTVRLKWPRSVALGLKHDLCAHRRIGADVIWYDWAHAFNQIDISLYNPSNPAIPPILAGVGASLPVRDVWPLNWTNSVSMRLGYESDFTDLDTFRCGYVYHASPVPNATLNPYLDGILEHAFSLGYSRKLGHAIFNAAYQYSFGPTHHVDTSSMVGGQFSDTTMFAQAHFAMLSLLFPF